ncbi:hypothetical protein ACS0TY_031562 [Phlomoides rotata]
MGSNGWELFPRSYSYHASSDTSLFSSSLPALAHEKLNLNELKHDHRSVYDASPSLKGKEVIQDAGNHTGGSLLHRSMYDASPSLKGKEVIQDGGNYTGGILLHRSMYEASPSLKGKEIIEDGGNHTDESLLPGEDELNAWLSSLVDVPEEECDLFGSSGGLELEPDTQENLRFGVSNLSLSNRNVGNGGARLDLNNGVGTFAGVHPLGEHPSRTLFVRNINSSVEDAEIRSLFEHYGDIRTMYTACKLRGFVMISYFDIRAARDAMRGLQSKPLQRRKLNIHYSIPKENPTDKEINQGTLVVFNLEPSITNDELLAIFGVHGEIKEIRETLHRRHHRFIEFYDIRAAEAALRSLNGSEIAGKRIKIEPSRPGGARRSLLLQLNHELEQEERNLQHVRSLVENSPPAYAYNRNSPLSSSLPGSSTRPFSGPPYFGGNSELYAETTATRAQAIMHPFILSCNDVFPFVNNHASFCSSDKPHQLHHHQHFHVGSAHSIGNVSPVSSTMSPRLSPVFPAPNLEAYAEPGRPQRAEINEFQMNNMNPYYLDLDKIRTGEDTRTTLMIKNIPNKYTSNMLLDAINEHHMGTFDFLYLPIDFKNKCNMGYAFINMLSPSYIIPFYEAFNKKKWEKFNSEKIASLAYGRIQGKSALIAHFQNSSLMNVEKRCRPILLNINPPESSH